MTRFDKLLAIMIKPWMAISIIGLIILSVWYMDRPIAYYFHMLDLQTHLTILTWFTHLGSNKLYIIPLLLWALFFRYMSPNKTWEARIWFLWLCVLIPSIICILLKILFGRTRPELLFSDHLYGFYFLQRHTLFWSFPSGHATTIMGFVFGLSALLPRYSYWFIFPGLLVVLSRIMLTHHYLSDVIAASYIALLEVTLLYYWLRKRKFFSDVLCLKPTADVKRKLK